MVFHKELGRSRSMDNLFIVRLWRTVKYENVYLKDNETTADQRCSLFKPDSVQQMGSTSKARFLTTWCFNPRPCTGRKSALPSRTAISTCAASFANLSLARQYAECFEVGRELSLNIPKVFADREPAG